MKNKPRGKPISPQKLAANRENAKRSTGPQTPKGKQRSSENSFKHGFYGRRLFPSKELFARDGEDYNRVSAAYWNLYSPVGDVEKLYVEKIAVYSLRLARLLGHEQKVLTSSAPFEGRSVDKIVRYESNINRQLEKAIDQLEHLQRAREAASGQLETTGLESDDAISELDEATEKQSDAPKDLIPEQPQGDGASSSAPDAALKTAQPHVARSAKQDPAPTYVEPSNKLAETAGNNPAPPKPNAGAQTLSKVIEQAMSPTPAPQRKDGLGSDENYGTNPPDCSRFIETAEDQELVERMKRGDFDHLEPLE